jgi:hypothetical protein
MNKTLIISALHSIQWANFTFHNWWLKLCFNRNIEIYLAFLLLVFVRYLPEKSCFHLN